MYIIVNTREFLRERKSTQHSAQNIHSGAGCFCFTCLRQKRKVPCAFYSSVILICSCDMSPPGHITPRGDTLCEQKAMRIKPDYDRYMELELKDAPHFFVQLFSRFRGCELAIVATTSIALLTEHDTPWPSALSMVCITALAIIHGLITRERHATPTQQSVQDTDEPGHARADQAPS